MEKLKQGLEFIFSSYKRTATILFIAALTLAIPFTLTFLGQNQDIRQQASQVCENVAADIILAIDKSGSMEADNAITKAKVAASSFVDVISKDANNRVGLVSYSSKSRTNLDNALTSNFTSVKEKINQLSASGATCIECAIKRANDEISASGRDNFKNAVVLLTDGKANVILSSDNNVGFDIAAEAALKRAKEGFDQNGTVYFTVGLGNEVQTDFLQKIANLSGGKYFAAPTANDLQAIYNQISQIIGKSSISGFVFEDVNSNGILDENETRLTGWTINLTNKANPNATTPIATDESGGFSFSGLCTGEYQLSAVNQSGWTISSPQNNVYDFLLVNGATSTEQNFGVKPVAQITPSPTETPIPTPTCTPRPVDVTGTPEPDGGWCPAPNSTTLDLSITLTGIGNASNSALGLNNNPERPERIAEVKVINAQNQEVKSGTQSLVYDSTTGTYKGKFDLGSNFITGPYLVKTRLDNTLWKTIPGIQQIISGTYIQTTTTKLITGDVDENNEINLLDYNMFLTCLQTNDCGREAGTAGFFEKIWTFVKRITTNKVFAQARACGGSGGLSCPTGFSCTGVDPDNAASTGTCQPNPICGDKICQDITCQAIGCPAPETAESCPSDCQGTQASPSATSVPSITTFLSPTNTPAPTTNPEVNTPEKSTFDFNDDGIVDELDLNILYAGFAERLGD